MTPLLRRTTTSEALPDMLLLALGCVLLQAPELLGLLHADPRLLLSGLGRFIQPGLFVGHGGFIDPNSAWTTQVLGHLSADEWLAGRVPWWNSYVGVGAPLAAEMQPASFFLPFVLLLHFAQGWLWLHIALQTIAATGAYLLARQLGLGRTACLVCGVLYGCNGTTAWFSHGPERVASFLPWILIGVEYCRTDRRGAALLAIALSFSITAGFPETAYLDGLLAAGWALLRLMQSSRGTAFAARIGAGGVAALLLCAPVIVSFAQYLAQADTGGHAGMSEAHLPWPGIAMLLLPYLNGPVSAAGAPAEALWGSVGGYLGVAAVTLALIAAFTSSRERAMRWLLLGWLIGGTARAAGVQPFVWVSNLVPLVGLTAFYRYITPSLAMAACVLAAFAIDDWRRRASDRHALIACLCTLALGIAAVAGCRHLHALTAHHLLERASWHASILWALGVLAAFAVLLHRLPGRFAQAACLALVCADAGGMYLAARAGAPRSGTIDLAPVRFLQTHAGFTRVLSLRGGMFPNESAWHRIAGIDETMLPVPLNWANFVRSRLQTDPIALLHVGTSFAELARNWPAYRGLGVGWIMTARAHGPAHALANVGGDTSMRRAVLSQPGAPVHGVLLAGLPGRGPVLGLGIDIGTFAGTADGTLTLTLEGAFGTATGRVALRGAADNAPIEIALDRPVPSGFPLRWTITQTGHPAAIWFYGNTPRFSVPGHWPGFVPHLAYADAAVEIYKVADPAPYMQAKHCALSATDRLVATADCAVPSSLLRRELFFPGWRATVNGMPIHISADDLFQRIDLPAGRSRIVFRYAPPGIALAWLAGLAGLLLTLGLLIPARRIR